MNNNNLFIINVVSYDIKNDSLLITIYMNDDYSLLIRLVMIYKHDTLLITIHTNNDDHSLLIRLFMMHIK